MSDPIKKTEGETSSALPAFLEPQSSNERVISRRRGSSLGKIDLGDTAGPSIQTMPSNQKMELSKKRRLSRLEERVEGDMSVWNKFWLTFVELNSRQTWLTPALIITAVYAAYFLSGNYTESNVLHAFVTLSYEIPGTEPRLYGKGKKDFLFVGFYMIVFTFWREFTMQVFLKPLAKHYGITREKKVARFLEQTFAMCYYGVVGPLGLYIMSTTPIWYFNTTQFWLDYPHKTHEYLFKFYYLAQLSFWAQLSVLMLLQVEAPRKDFKELVFHHIITIVLIFLSYRFHFTWIGLAVYITMDVSDFFLALSKTLNYLDSPAIAPFFGIFVGTWIYFRHYLNIKFLWSILTEFKTVGRYDLDWVEQNYKCWISQPIVFGLIFALHLVNLFWLYLLLRIAYRFIFLNIAKDDRSDDESEEGEEETEQQQVEEKKDQ